MPQIKILSLYCILAFYFVLSLSQARVLFFFYDIQEWLWKSAAIEVLINSGNKYILEVQFHCSVLMPAVKRSAVLMCFHILTVCSPKLCFTIFSCGVPEDIIVMCKIHRLWNVHIWTVCSLWYRGLRATYTYEHDMIGKSSDLLMLCTCVWAHVMSGPLVSVFISFFTMLYEVM